MKKLHFVHRTLLPNLLLGLLAWMGCDQSRDNSYLMANVSGKANEVIVVINKTLWDGPLGDSIFQILTYEYPGLPQGEPYFDVSNVTPQAFESLESLRTFRNLLIVDIGSEHGTTGHTLQHDKWAKQQLVLTLKAPNAAAMHSLLQKKGELIRTEIHDAEAKRIQRNYNQYADVALIEQLLKETQATMTIPKNYKLEQKYSDFLWLAHETPEMSQGIFLYWYPYSAESQFTKDSLVARRNEFLQKYVPGPLKGSYMTTDMQLPIDYQHITQREEFAAELRGLWYTQGDFMGGPFVSISKVDKERNRIVTAEGFVYAPKFPKRNYILQVEQIVKTLRFEE